MMRPFTEALSAELRHSEDVYATKRSPHVIRAPTLTPSHQGKEFVEIDRSCFFLAE